MKKKTNSLSRLGRTCTCEIKIQRIAAYWRYILKTWRRKSERELYCIMVHLIWYLLRDNCSICTNTRMHIHSLMLRKYKKVCVCVWHTIYDRTQWSSRVTNSPLFFLMHVYCFCRRIKFMILNLVRHTICKRLVMLAGMMVKKLNNHSHIYTHTEHDKQ